MSFAAEKGLAIKSATLLARLLRNFMKVTASTSGLNEQLVTTILRPPVKVEGLACLYEGQEETLTLAPSACRGKWDSLIRCIGDGEFWTARGLAHYTAHFTGLDVRRVTPGEPPILAEQSQRMKAQRFPNVRLKFANLARSLASGSGLRRPVGFVRATPQTAKARLPGRPAVP